MSYDNIDQSEHSIPCHMIILINHIAAGGQRGPQQALQCGPKDQGGQRGGGGTINAQQHLKVSSLVVL